MPLQVTAAIWMLGLAMVLVILQGLWGQHSPGFYGHSSLFLSQTNENAYCRLSVEVRTSDADNVCLFCFNLECRWAGNSWVDNFKIGWMNVWEELWGPAPQWHKRIMIFSCYGFKASSYSHLAEHGISKFQLWVFISHAKGHCSRHEICVLS